MTPFDFDSDSVENTTSPAQEESDGELGSTTVRDPESSGDWSDESNVTIDTNSFSNAAPAPQTCSVRDMNKFINLVRKTPATKVMEIPKNSNDGGVLANLLSLEGRALTKVLTFVAEDLQFLDYESALDSVLDSLLQSGVHQIFDKIDLGRRGSGAMVLALTANCLILISLYNFVYHLIIKGIYRTVATLGRHLRLHGFRPCECRCHLASQTEAGSNLGLPNEPAPQEPAPLENGRDNNGFQGENLGGGVNAEPSLGLANPNADYEVVGHPPDDLVSVDLNSPSVPFEGGEGTYFENSEYMDPLLALREPIPEKSIRKLAERRPQGRPLPETSFLSFGKTLSKNHGTEKVSDRKGFLAKLCKASPPKVPSRRLKEYEQIEMSNLLKSLDLEI